MATPYEEVDLGLSFDLAVGVRTGTENRREVDLLPGNGITEKVFLKKTPDKPYSWIGNVLAVAFKSIGGVPVGAEAREEFIKTGGITLPAVLQKLPLADANSSLMEVHRRLWQNLVPGQTCLCRMCGKQFVMDIDLNRVEFTDESKAWIEQNTAADEIKLRAALKYGFTFRPFVKEGDGLKDEAYAGTYNRFIFRAPTLGDAIRNEKYVNDEVVFWRRVAYDCLVSIERDGDELAGETAVVKLPKEIPNQLGLRLYDMHLSSPDLKTIRHTLKEVLPTLPFSYEETCPHCERATPVAIEATSFFSA